MVDRFTIKPDIENRLSESLETTLDLSNGIAKIISLDDSSLDILFQINLHAQSADTQYLS